MFQLFQRGIAVGVNIGVQIFADIVEHQRRKHKVRNNPRLPVARAGNNIGYQIAHREKAARSSAARNRTEDINIDVALLAPGVPGPQNRVQNILQLLANRRRSMEET